VIRGITIDMAAALGKFVEWDVPQFENLPDSQRHPEDPTIQVLERVGTVRELFSGTYFSPDIPEFIEFIEIHRCNGHMHIGGIVGMIINVETGDVICDNKAIYGEDPATNEGFITSIVTKNYDPPLVIAANTTVKVISHYDASVLHTGVMGLFAIFYADHKAEVLHPKETGLTVDLCESTCDESLLPSADDIEICVDTIETGFLCQMRNICDCTAFLALPEIAGCGTDWETPFGMTIPVDSICAKHCGCEGMNDEETKNKILTERVGDIFSQSYDEICKYATVDCEKYLSNLFSCSKELNENDVHPAVWEALEFKDGTRMPLERTKLGDAALHRFDKTNINEEVLPCANMNAPDDSGTNDGNSSSANGFFIVSAFSFIFTLSVVNFAFFW